MKKTKYKFKLRGWLNAYMYWPIYMTGLLLCFSLGTLIGNTVAGVVLLVFTAIYFVITFVIFYLRKDILADELTRFANSYSLVLHRLSRELDVPYGLLDMNGRLIWENDELKDIIVRERVINRNIKEIFPEITLDPIPTIEEDTEIHMVFNKRNYRVLLRVVDLDEFSDDAAFTMITPDNEERGTLIAMYLYDETEIVALTKENKDEKMIVGLLYIDNYEEAFENVDELKRLLIAAWVEREINKYMSSIDAIVKKLEKDKYIFVFKQKYLAQMEEAKFSILETIREMNIYDLTVTISIGVGVNEQMYSKSYELARAAIDLALGRGGDQAVVKDGSNIYYYGGKTAQLEKSTKVKARVKALALREYIEGKEKVMVMGHSMPDIDSLGAAVGVYKIANALQKKAYIVVSEATSASKAMIERFVETGEYDDDMFITGQKALDLIDENTLLVVVDVNRPSFTDTPALLNVAKMVVVVDHHRQGGEAIENAVLSYVETYASSASEMIVEFLQYVNADMKLKPIEADAMYGGIMIDTNNFLMKTGVRTFEACAYLRRNGADVTKIRKMFRTDFKEYQAKGMAVSAAEIYKECFAFTELIATGLDSPTIVAAQAANELMNIDNTKASFVFTNYNGKVYISARSIDELNVQVVMEKLGGGGHMSAAAAQLEDCTVEEAMDKVKTVIDEMMANKGI